MKRKSFKRFLEAEDHVYKFLIGTPAEEGFARFYTKTVHGKTLRDAVAQMYSCLSDPSISHRYTRINSDDLDPEENGFNRWFMNQSNLDKGATGKEILNVLKRRANRDSSKPWLVAYQVDGKLIDCGTHSIEDEVRDLQNNGRRDTLADFTHFLRFQSCIYLEGWGIDLPEIKAARTYDEEDYDENEGYTPTPQAIKRFFRGNPKYFNKAAKIIAGWYEEEDSEYGNYAFTSEEDFYDRAHEDIGELIDAADDDEERAIAEIAYSAYYKNTALKELLADEE